MVLPSKRERAFLKSAYDGDLTLVKRLASELVDGQRLTKGYESIMDNKGINALHWPVACCKIHVCRFLVEKMKFNVKSTDLRGTTLFFVVIMKHHNETVVYLIENGAPAIYCICTSGETALHRVAESGDEDRYGTDGGEIDIGEWLTAHRQLLDLDSLAFPLMMENNEGLLPEDSFRLPKEKNHEEVYVPGLKPTALAPGEELVKISSMPNWAQLALEVYKCALFSADNTHLCAPTSPGTNVAILQHIALNNNRDGSFSHGNYKIVYIAPMKALVAEVVSNLSQRLKHYGVEVKELSGDQSLTRQQIEETQIIVTTLEKWDSVTRKSGDRIYTQIVKLLIIDEIHLLHDNRGPVLESIVARTVRQIETTIDYIRLVGLSATLPNYEDVAMFLRVDPKKGLFHSDNSYRPVPLVQQYIGIPVKKKPLQRFQLMNNVCDEKLINAAGKHQVLVFVHSRKKTSKTARAIPDIALATDALGKFLNGDSASSEILQSHTDLVKSNDLKDLLPYGFAIHHVGMVRSDRQIVENLFLSHNVQVLISTATLDWGVNLPAHTVIIISTQIYKPEKGAWTELSPLDVMQQLGRARRPQYDTVGESIVITGDSQLKYYLSLMNQQLPIESQFVSRLADQLNAEIVLGIIVDAKEPSIWLKYTYLYRRMVKNPCIYGVSVDALKTDVLLEERLADLVHSTATILDKNSLVNYDRKSGYFQVTDIANFYYIHHGTIDEAKALRICLLTLDMGLLSNQFSRCAVVDVFFDAQKTVLCLTDPLFDLATKTVKPLCVRALKRMKEERGQLETWSVLRKFDYNTALRMADDQLLLPMRNFPDQVYCFDESISYTALMTFANRGVSVMGSDRLAKYLQQEGSTSMRKSAFLFGSVSICFSGLGARCIPLLHELPRYFSTSGHVDTLESVGWAVAGYIAGRFDWVNDNANDFPLSGLIMGRIGEDQATYEIYRYGDVFMNRRRNGPSVTGGCGRVYMDNFIVEHPYEQFRQESMETNDIEICVDYVLSAIKRAARDDSENCGGDVDIFIISADGATDQRLYEFSQPENRYKRKS